MAAFTTASVPNLHRAHRICSACVPHLVEAARSAESLPEQAFAEDLWAITQQLQAVLRAAERRRYVSPVQLSLR